MIRFVAVAAAVVVITAGCPQEQFLDGFEEAECRIDDDCGALRLCSVGACIDAPECLGTDDWSFCRSAIAELDPQEAARGRTAYCAYDDEARSAAHCVIGCETDDACPADSLCTDFGACVPGLRRAPTTATRGAHATLLAGVGEVVLDVPATTSLGGLSSRSGSGDGAWAAGMQASVGHLEGLSVRAVVLDSGDRRILLIRLPTIFPVAALTEGIAQALFDSTGDDWHDALVVAATHNHSGPARFLHLLREAEDTLGPFGVGTFRQELFDKYVALAHDAATQAIAAQQPAKLGWQIVEGFDVDDKVSGDRRGESPPFDDNRALLIRVDDDGGTPLFVVTGFGIHPTENGSNWATNDVVGGVERGLEDALFPVFGRTVPVLFVNGNGGSQSPSAGGRGFAVPHGNEATGAVVVDALLQPLLDIETKADIDLAARAHRFHVTTPLLGYAPGEWTNSDTAFIGPGEVGYGGLNCFNNVPGDDDGDDDTPYAAALTREQMQCGIPLHGVLFNRPATVFQRTQISAVSIDGLSILTLPGELTMELGWGIAAELQRAHGVDPLALYTMGYANDHLMYLLPTSLNEDAPPWPGYTGPAPSTYPPAAFSPLRGGFEANTSLYGDRLGDYLVGESMLAWQRLQDDSAPDVEVAPAVYSVDVKAPIAIIDTPADRAGVVVVDLPATLPRRTLTPFTFVGGDVAVDGFGPEVTLVREDGTPVLQKSGRPLSTHHALFPLGVKRVGGEYHWTAHLELPVDLDAGRYRLDVVGRAQRDGAVVAYSARSTVFTVGSAPLVVRAVRDGNDVVVDVGFASVVPVVSDARLTGPLRLLDARVASGRLSPVDVVGATVAGNVVVDPAPSEVVVDGDIVTRVTLRDVPAEAFVVDVVDVVGNVGSIDVAAR